MWFITRLILTNSNWKPPMTARFPLTHLVIFFQTQISLFLWHLGCNMFQNNIMEQNHSDNKNNFHIPSFALAGSKLIFLLHMNFVCINFKFFFRYLYLCRLFLYNRQWCHIGQIQWNTVEDTNRRFGKLDKGKSYFICFMRGWK